MNFDQSEKPPLMSIYIATNDRNGDCDGYIRAVTIDLENAPIASLAELEGEPLACRWCGDSERKWFRGQYARAPHMLKVVGRGRLPVWRLRRHVGNIHWDEIGITVTHGLYFLRWLALSGWRMTSAQTDFFTAFNETLDPRAMTADDYCASLLQVIEKIRRHEQ